MYVRLGVEPAVTAGLVRSTVAGWHTGSGLFITRVGKGPGCWLIITSADTADVQPPAFVTVKLYDPGLRPNTVKVVPDALAVMLPGKRVSVQVPSAGNPVITTLPVGESHVGWVMVPGTGGVGVSGCGLIITSCEGSEVHSLVPLTENVYVPGCMPVIVVLTPVPEYVAPSGWRVRVHDPAAGRLEMNTLPVEI